MTPETARDLEPGTTPGPWEASECTGFIAAAEGERPVLTADRGDWWCEEDHRLAAAAPDMRATIAAQTWEYGVERKNPTKDYWEQITLQDGELWAHAEAYAEETAVWSRGIGYSSRLIRRPVGPVEVVEG